jgi:hypothetical protein
MPAQCYKILAELNEWLWYKACTSIDTKWAHVCSFYEI